MISLYNSGIAVTVPDEEVQIASVNQVGEFVLIIDMTTITDGDSYSIYSKQKLLTGDTAETVQKYVFDFSKVDEPIFNSVHIVNDLAESDSVVFTIMQTLGTGHSFSWKVLNIADNSDIDAIKLKTDKLTFDVSNNVYANSSLGALAVSEVVAQNVASGIVSILTAYDFSEAITSTSTLDLSTADNIIFSIKKNTKNTDAQSIIFVDTLSGLSVVNGSTYLIPSNGSVVITGSSGSWIITVSLNATVTSLLTGLNVNDYVGEIKAIIGSNIVPLWSGSASIDTGVIRALV